MKELLGCVILQLLLANGLTAGDVNHYWGGGEKHYLARDSTRIRVKWRDGVSATPVLQGVLSTRFLIMESANRDPDGFTSYELAAQQGYTDAVSAATADSNVYVVEPFYLNAVGEPYYAGLEFCVGFRAGVTRVTADSLARAYGVVVDREVKGMPNVLVMKNTDCSYHGLLEIADIFYRLEQTYFSHPNCPGLSKFGFEYYELSDEYHPYQWQIKEVIGSFNQGSVWDFAGLGDSIVVAVLDDGVKSHWDLPPERILSGYGCVGDSTDGSPGPYVGHGMACAGIIAAEHAVEAPLLKDDQSTGILSMDPHVRILPIRISDKWGSLEYTTQVDIAEGIGNAWRNGASVMSNSWYSNEYSDIIAAACDSAYVHGRSGLGCPLIFCSGNSAQAFPELVGFPAHLNQCLAVGAVDVNDYPFEYSQYGSELDLVAPSGDFCGLGDVWSLDQELDYGWNPYVTRLTGCTNTITWDCDSVAGNEGMDFNCTFGGTSAAAPIVSGAAALLLARDPEMPVDDPDSEYDVYDVLRKSAVPLGYGQPNDYYGWGRVDAYRAVLSIARGDANNNGEISIGDPCWLINYLFIEGDPPFPDLLLGDANCDGEVTISDIEILIDYLFVSMEPLPLPCFAFGS